MLKTDGMFANCPLTPEAYHRKHVESWENYDSDNVLVVSYERLLTDFEDEMLSIANYMDSDVRTFKDGPRTGVWSPSEPGPWTPQ